MTIDRSRPGVRHGLAGALLLTAALGASSCAAPSDAESNPATPTATANRLKSERQNIRMPHQMIPHNQQDQNASKIFNLLELMSMQIAYPT